MHERQYFMHKVPKKEGVVLGMKAWHEVGPWELSARPMFPKQPPLEAFKDLLKFSSFEQEKRDLTYMVHLLLRYKCKARQGKARQG
jgi:hypothetical protein